MEFSSYKVLELVYHEERLHYLPLQKKIKSYRHLPSPLSFQLADKTERSQAETWVLSIGLRHSPTRQFIKGLCNENHSAKDGIQEMYTFSQRLQTDSISLPAYS